VKSRRPDPDGIAFPSDTKNASSEPKTSLGNFYRAHRTEVLAGGGIAVALFAYWRSKSSSNSAAAQSASTTPSSSTPTSIDPNAGGGYYGSGGGGSSYSDPYGTLPPGSITPTDPNNNGLYGVVTQNPPPTTSQPPVTTPPDASPQPVTSSRPALAKAMSTTSENLAKYRAQVASSPDAKNRAAVTALSHRLNVERSIAQGRGPAAANRRRGLNRVRAR